MSTFLFNSRSTTSSDLTPVAVRGKKRAAPSRIPTPMPSPPPTKRPRTSNKKLSPLECLPPELLEEIFLHACCNISLPRASPYIGAKLSSEHTYTQCLDRVLCSFKHYIPSRYDSYGDRQVSQWHHYSGETGGEDVVCMRRTRQEVLLNKWVTAERFMKARKRVLEREMARLKSATNIASKQDPVLELWLESRIPVRLLQQTRRGDPNMEYLDILVEVGCKLDIYESLDGERAADVLVSAISDRQYRLVHRLLSKGIEVQAIFEDLEPALTKITWEEPMIRLILFCLQIKLASDQDEPLYCRRGSVNRIPYDKAVTSRWINVSYTDVHVRDQLVRQLRSHATAFGAYRGSPPKDLHMMHKDLKKFRKTWGGQPCVPKPERCAICLRTEDLSHMFQARWHDKNFIEALEHI